jgi:menaquinone-dependent protoporphyrinogen oxidase
MDIIRAMVGFGTNYGSTKDIAQEIATVLRGDGWNVDVYDLGTSRPIEPEAYDLFVIGSGIKMGAWSKEALRFIKDNMDVLHRKRVSLFVSCGDMLDPAKEAEARKKYIDDVVNQYPGLVPYSVGIFGGVFDFKKYGILVRGVLKNLRKGLEAKGVDISEPYDFRDWDAIREFARGLSGH